MSATEYRPAIERARRAWKCLTADVYRSRCRRDGAPSSWLKDHGGRPTRGLKAPDQLARLAHEMHEAGYSEDAIDRELVDLVRGIVRTAVQHTPAHSTPFPAA